MGARTNGTNTNKGHGRCRSASRYTDDRDGPGINGRGVRRKGGMKNGMPPELDAPDAVLDADTLVVDAETDGIADGTEGNETESDAIEAESEDSTEEIEDSTEDITDDTLDITEDGSTEEEGS